MLITFEGSEGAGKSTIIKEIGLNLQSLGEKIAITREPGGTPIAEKIRDFVKYNQDIEPFFAETELLMMLASRIQHVNNFIIPKLDNSYVVISDRYIHSTIAYQGAGRGINQNYIWDLHKKFCHNLMPDLTFFLSVDYETSQERIQKRLNKKSSSEIDRFDNLSIDFSNRVNECFLSFVDNKKFILIDATKPISTIINEIMKKFNLK